MKTLNTIVLGCALAAGCLLTGCEVSHTETHKDTLFGHKHESTTVTENPITGDTTVRHSEQRIND